MSHSNTVISQLLKLLPRHEFESLANKHHVGRAFRKASRWSQLVTLVVAQISGRRSLRDIVENMTAQTHRLYHLGSARLSRTSLSRINEDKPYTLYEELFGRLLSRCQQVSPRHKFSLHKSVYSLDSSTIDLCLSAFPWAEFVSTKGAIKLHVGLNHDGYLPEFVAISDGKTHDLTAAKKLNFPKGSIVVADKAYTDFGWYKQLTDKGIFFVTRQKNNAKYRVVERRKCLKSKGIVCDQIIKLSGYKTSKIGPDRLRRVSYRDQDTGKLYTFLTNNMKLCAKTIADLYKARWQVELFFKWIKQNLKIKSFLGTSKNAVLTQIWIALCVYLLLSFLKFQSRIDLSLQQIIRLLQLNLFEKRDLMALLRGEPINGNPPDHLQAKLF